MSEIVVRPARAGEFADIGELTVEAYRVDGFLGDSPDYARELADTATRAEHAEVLVAVDGNGELLGSVTAVLPGTRYAEMCRDGEFEFRMLAVARSARGRGVGEALTRAVLDRAHDHGARRVVLCSMDRMRTAHRLYERLGFDRLPERDWQPVPQVRLVAYSLEMPA